MTTSTHSGAPYPDITDELLSAYLDGMVTPAERQRVEAAAVADPDVAWRLATLRETVRLLRTLPVLELPRSFVLTPAQVGQLQSAAVAAELMPKPAVRTPHSTGFWGRAGPGVAGVLALGQPGTAQRDGGKHGSLFCRRVGRQCPVGPTQRAGPPQSPGGGRHGAESGPRGGRQCSAGGHHACRRPDPGVGSSA